MWKDGAGVYDGGGDGGGRVSCLWREEKGKMGRMKGTNKNKGEEVRGKWKIEKCKKKS